MATIGPIAITDAWTKVYDCSDDGDFSGGIQASSNSPVYLRVTDDSTEPTEQGGFYMGQEIYGFAATGTQAVWARTGYGDGSIVLG